MSGTSVSSRRGSCSRFDRDTYLSSHHEDCQLLKNNIHSHRVMETDTFCIKNQIRSTKSLKLYMVGFCVQIHSSYYWVNWQNRAAKSFLFYPIKTLQIHHLLAKCKCSFFKLNSLIFLADIIIWHFKSYYAQSDALLHLFSLWKWRRLHQKPRNHVDSQGRGI